MKIVDFFSVYIPFYKRNLKIAIPVMLSQLGQGVVMFVDTFMVGKLGTNELAASSFANSVFVSLYLFAMGVSIGLTPLVGQSFSGREERKTKVFFQNSFVVNFLIIIVVCILLYILSFFFENMGQEQRVIELAHPYYLWLILSLLPLSFFFSFKQQLEGLGNTKYSMIITLISNAINILFNYFLIFGACGFPKLGIVGAGVSTFISRLCMPIMFVFFYFFDKKYRPYLYSFRENMLSFKTIKNLFSVGFPIGFQMFVETLVFGLSGVMVGWFGAVSLAAHQVVMNFSSLTFLIQSGIASATTIRVSHQFGVKDFYSMRKAGIASLHLSLVFNMVCALMMLIFRYELVSFFSTDANVIDIAVVLMILCAIYQVADGLQVVAIGSLRGMTDVKLPMRVAVFCYLIVTIPIGYIMSVIFNLEAKGIWIGFIVGLNIAAVILIRRFLKMSKVCA